MVKNNLTHSEILQIIERNNLQCFVNESNNIKTYDNARTKNLTGGILIKIVGDKLKIEGSIHKYFHFLQYRTLENYTVFTMKDFLNTVETLFKNFAISKDNLLIINYEIGLNIFLKDREPVEYLKKVRSIGNLDGTQRKIYINPKYKNERFLCTQMHKDNTVVYRIYDKNFERTDKGKKNSIPNCIRIETLRTRQKKLYFSDFCTLSNLTILQNKFFSEWNKLNFDKEVQAPAGTHKSKKALAKKLIIDGTKNALQELEERRNQTTPKIYKTEKRFIKNWDTYKNEFSLIPCEISPIWDLSYNIAIQQIIKSSITN